MNGCSLHLRSVLSILLVVLACFVVPHPATAHSMYQSAVLLDFHGRAVDVELQLPLSRVDLALGTPIDAQTLPPMSAVLSSYLLDRVHARSTDGRAFAVHMTAPASIATIEGAPYLIALFELEPPVGAQTNVFDLDDDVLLDTLPSSVALVSIRTDWSRSTFANDPEFVGVLRGSARSITIERSEGSWFRGFGSIFRLGVRHIAEGTDHLLFLLALLLPAPLLALHHRWSGPVSVRSGFLRILRIVTAFTLGHSLTLAAAASGLVHFPESPIEVLIAFSILVSAIHALRPIFPGKEAFVAAFFGLIHGLAFATTLAGLGLGRWERVASIFAFNLGIEAMQLVVVLATMPSLVLLSRTPLYTPMRIGGGLFACTAAIGWISQRLVGTQNPINPIVEGLALHGVWIATGLFGIAFTAATYKQFSPKTALRQNLTGNETR